MDLPPFDRMKLSFRALRERENRVNIEREWVRPDAEPGTLTDSAQRVIDETANRMVKARDKGRARMLTFGAHAIKNGLGPIMAQLIEDGWITHLATNGAGIIHDWEFAYQGASSEHVQENVAEGWFGAWRETGELLNLAINIGAYRGLGYGASVGAMAHDESLDIPSAEVLEQTVLESLASNPPHAAASADLLDVVRALNLAPGRMPIPHPFKRFGLQAAAYRLGIPFTGHPMIGHDIIYLHPMNRCAAIGRTAERDFLQFVSSVSELDGGVYLSIGSAVMSPMVFEKSLSMARNAARQNGASITNHFITVVDLAESTWDWSKGEPPHASHDYYLRFNKSFSRMGGTLRYVQADNRDFLLALTRALRPNQV